VQYGLVGLVGTYASEPWPAVVLPGFKSVYETEGEIAVEQAAFQVVFVDGGRAAIAPAQMLAPLPRSHHPSFLRAQCRPASLSGTGRTERCRHPDARRWFLARAGTLFPSRAIREVHVTWERLEIGPRGTVHRRVFLDALRLTDASHPGVPDHVAGRN
jgi:hypothetical protein